MLRLVQLKTESYSLRKQRLRPRSTSRRLFRNIIPEHRRREKRMKQWRRSQYRMYNGNIRCAHMLLSQGPWESRLRILHEESKISPAAPITHLSKSLALPVYPCECLVSSSRERMTE